MLLKLILLGLLIPTLACATVTVSGVNMTGVSNSPGDRIYAVGDSITLGLTDSPALFGYRDHLQGLVGVGRYNFVGAFTDPDTDATYDVDHGAVSGTRTTNILARIQSDLETYMPRPNTANSKVLLFIGTNDSAQGTGDNLPPPVTPVAAVDNVEAIVALITAYDSNLSVYVALITPHREFGSVKNNTNFINYNNELEPAILAIRAGNSKVHLVDMYNAYVADTFALLSGNYLNTAYSDDTHPNNLGYTVIARQWYSCFQSATNVNCNGN